MISLYNMFTAQALTVKTTVVRGMLVLGLASLRQIAMIMSDNSTKSYNKADDRHKLPGPFAATNRCR